VAGCMWAHKVGSRELAVQAPTCHRCGGTPRPWVALRHGPTAAVAGGARRTRSRRHRAGSRCDFPASWRHGKAAAARWVRPGAMGTRPALGSRCDFAGAGAQHQARGGGLEGKRVGGGRKAGGAGGGGTVRHTEVERNGAENTHAHTAHARGHGCTRGAHHQARSPAGGTPPLWGSRAEVRDGPGLGHLVLDQPPEVLLSCRRDTRTSTPGHPRTQRVQRARARARSSSLPPRPRSCASQHERPTGGGVARGSRSQGAHLAGVPPPACRLAEWPSGSRCGPGRSCSPG
jgi:hypothetical protein